MGRTFAGIRRYSFRRDHAASASAGPFAAGCRGAVEATYLARRCGGGTTARAGYDMILWGLGEESERDGV